MLELVDFGELELGFMYLLYIIPLFSLLGMWGHAGYVVWVQTYFWLYIYIYIWCCAANFVLQVAACLSLCLFCSLSCPGFWLKMNLIC